MGNPIYNFHQRWSWRTCEKPKPRRVWNLPKSPSGGPSSPAATWGGGAGFSPSVERVETSVFFTGEVRGYDGVMNCDFSSYRREDGTIDVGSDLVTRTRRLEPGMLTVLPFKIWDFHGSVGSCQALTEPPWCCSFKITGNWVVQRKRHWVVRNNV